MICQLQSLLSYLGANQGASLQSEYGKIEIAVSSHQNVL